MEIKFSWWHIGYQQESSNVHPETKTGLLTEFGCSLHAVEQRRRIFPAADMQHAYPRPLWNVTTFCAWSLSPFCRIWCMFVHQCFNKMTLSQDLYSWFKVLLYLNFCPHNSRLKDWPPQIECGFCLCSKSRSVISWPMEGTTTVRKGFLTPADLDSNKAGKYDDQKTRRKFKTKKQNNSHTCVELLKFDLKL